MRFTFSLAAQPPSIHPVAVGMGVERRWVSRILPPLPLLSDPRIRANSKLTNNAIKRIENLYNPNCKKCTLGKFVANFQDAAEQQEQGNGVEWVTKMASQPAIPALNKNIARNLFTARFQKSTKVIVGRRAGRRRCRVQVCATRGRIANDKSCTSQVTACT